MPPIPALQDGVKIKISYPEMPDYRHEERKSDPKPLIDNESVVMEQNLAPKSFWTKTFSTENNFGRKHFSADKFFGGTFFRPNIFSVESLETYFARKLFRPNIFSAENMNIFKI